MCRCWERVNHSVVLEWAGLIYEADMDRVYRDVPAMLTWLMTQVRLMVLPAFTYSGPRISERDSGKEGMTC